MTNIKEIGLKEQWKENAIPVRAVLTTGERDILLKKRNHMNQLLKESLVEKFTRFTFENDLMVSDIQHFSTYWQTDCFLEMPKIFQEALQVHLFHGDDVIAISYNEQRDIKPKIDSVDKEEIAEIEKLIPGYQLKKIFQKEKVQQALIVKFLKQLEEAGEYFKTDENFRQAYVEFILDVATAELRKEERKKTSNEKEKSDD